MKRLTVAGLCLFFLLIFFSRASHAGGCSGGGGSFLRTSENPWFIDTTKTVSYCVEVGAPGFPAGVEAIVGRAIEAWRKELAHANRYPTNYFFLGTQTFTRVGDCAAADLVFNFGKLTPEIQGRMEDRRRHIALALRTRYDEASLKGGGIIYVAPDEGPDAFDKSAKVPPQVWTRHDAVALYWVLAHELGHVFGVPHVRPYKMWGDEHLMAETFPEYILENVDSLPPARESYFFNRIFEYDFVRNRVQRFQLFEEGKKALGLAEWGELGVSWTAEDEAALYLIPYATGKAAPATRIGTLKVTKTRRTTSNGVYLWLPPGNLFEPTPSMASKYVPGPRFVRGDYSATITLTNGRRLGALLQTDPVGFEVISLYLVENGGVTFDIGAPQCTRECRIP